MNSISVLILILFLALVSSELIAQPIEIKPNGYFMDGERIRYSEMVQLMQSDEEAYKLLESSQSSIVTGAVFSVVALGVGVAEFIHWGNSNNLMPRKGPVIIALGLSLSGGILVLGGNATRKRAVKLYNSGITNHLTYRYRQKFDNRIK